MERTVIEKRLKEAQARAVKLQVRLEELARETRDTQVAFQRVTGEMQCLASLLPEFDKDTGKGEGGDA